MYQFILLQAGDSSGYGSLFLLLGIVIIFYFFMIRPQQKKQKDQKKFVEQIKKGDNVVTVGGIHGKITNIEGDTITLEVERGARIKFDKSSVSLDASKKYSTESK